MTFYFSHNVPSPCHGCKDRVLGCHDTCDKYKEFRGVIDQKMLDKENYLAAHPETRNFSKKFRRDK